MDSREYKPLPPVLRTPGPSDIPDFSVPGCAAWHEGGELRKAFMQRFPSWFPSTPPETRSPEYLAAERRLEAQLASLYVIAATRERIAIQAARNEHSDWLSHRDANLMTDDFVAAWGPHISRRAKKRRAAALEREARSQEIRERLSANIDLPPVSAAPGWGGGWGTGDWGTGSAWTTDNGGWGEWRPQGRRWTQTGPRPGRYDRRGVRMFPDDRSRRGPTYWQYLQFLASYRCPE
ncbi:hypothetical protein B0H11DRAFT_2248607 [Mycena galericulata]|nr:hypothetical protein B0H11DRAFT_2248607 [Mycena galericulata]